MADVEELFCKDFPDFAVNGKGLSPYFDCFERGYYEAEDICEKRISELEKHITELEKEKAKYSACNSTGRLIVPTPTQQEFCTICSCQKTKE